MAALVLLTIGPVGATAAGPTKTPTIKGSIRVSHDCTVRITGRWSNLSAPATMVFSDLYYDGIYRDYQEQTGIIGGTRGSWTFAWQGTPSTTQHTVGAAVDVYNSVDGWVQSGIVSTSADCEAPFTQVAP